MDNKIKRYSMLVEKQLSTIKNYTNTLNNHITHNTDLISWFRELCALLTKLIVYFTDFHKNVDRIVEYKEKLLLYLNQFVTILSLLINIFVRESELDRPLPDIRFFCKKQIFWSLGGLENILSNPLVSIPSDNFIKWVDSALEKLSEIDYINMDKAITNFTEANLYFEEVLSHAMSIAQMALEEDYKKIRGSSQSVLEALASFSNEIHKTKPNTAMLNIFRDTCRNKLYALENKVNTGILRLSLEIFSEFIKPLEAIQNFCFDKSNRGKQDKLDNLVVKFDLHVDRILQIGLFAVACSSYSNNCVKMKNSLASLEALETELVPAFTSVLQESNINKIQLALLLKDHWICEARTLKRLIYLIISPYAFCKVIYEENKQLVQHLEETVKAKCILDINCFEKLTKHSKILSDFIKVVLEEEHEINQQDIRIAFSEFTCVLQEVKSAQEILPQNKTSYLRILKRCKILLNSIKNIYSCFLNENSERESISIKEKDEVDKNFVDDGTKKIFGNAFFDHIMARGQQILKDRSILYEMSDTNTFKVPLHYLSNQNGLEAPSIKLTHFRNKTFNYTNKSSDELQMTDILNELNNLSQASLSRK